MEKNNDTEVKLADIVPAEGGIIDEGFILQLFSLHRRTSRSFRVFTSLTAFTFLLSCRSRLMNVRTAPRPPRRSRATITRRSLIRYCTTSAALSTTV